MDNSWRQVVGLGRDASTAREGSLRSPSRFAQHDRLSKLQIRVDLRVGLAISTRKSAPVAEVKKNLSERIAKEPKP
jgi:hypothetical protein